MIVLKAKVVDSTHLELSDPIAARPMREFLEKLGHPPATRALTEGRGGDGGEFLLAFKDPIIHLKQERSGLFTGSIQVHSYRIRDHHLNCQFPLAGPG